MKSSNFEFKTIGMRILVVIFVLISVLSTSCKGNIRSSQFKDDVTEETIALNSICEAQTQDFVDSVYERYWEFHDKNAAIFFTKLKGNVRSVSYDSGILSPYKVQIDIDEYGKISGFTATDEERQEIDVQEILDENCMINGKSYYISTWTRLDFSESPNKNRSEIITYGDGSSSKYTLRYSDECNLNRIDMHGEYYDDYESEVPSIVNILYKVDIVEVDVCGNWTKLKLIARDPVYDKVITRKVSYYNDSDKIRLYPKLIKTPLKDKIFCYFNTGNDRDKMYSLLCFDCNLRKWTWFLPPDFRDGGFCMYQDFRVVGDKMYLIYDTNACGIVAVFAAYIIFEYDLKNDSWTELAVAGGECEFIGDKIKVVSYEIVEERDCTANHVYKEHIDWIDMK